MDLNDRLMFKRGTGSPIVIQKRLQANKKESSIMLNKSIRWGWRYPMLTYKRRQEISKSTCRLVAYNYRFDKNPALSQIPWRVQ